MLRILPESKGNLVAAQASGKLTAEDYHDVWAPKLQEVVAREEALNVAYDWIL